MIKYNLRCDADHEFEGWFRSSNDYDQQAASGLMECPVCGSVEVRKAIMAPAIARSSGKSADSAREERLKAFRSSMREAVDRARTYVEQNFDYVGPSFPEEARRIHYGETEARGIYGEATGREAKELIDEGIELAPLPGPAPKTDIAGTPINTVEAPKPAKVSKPAEAAKPAPAIAKSADASEKKKMN